MSEKIPFIGREQELALVHTLIDNWGSASVLFIQGAGGIGKTRFLQEIHELASEQNKTDLQIMFIDMDDPAMQSGENLGSKIARMLDEKRFATYFESLWDWRKMELAGVSPTGLTYQGKIVRQAFISEFNKISSERRLVLLVDTTDKLDGTEVWDYVTHLILNAQNTFFVIAGRNAESLYNSLTTNCSKAGDITLLQLPPLDKNDSQQYLTQKQRALNIILEPAMIQLLPVLTQGRPILIDLAVEWMMREIPVDWITEGYITDTQTLPADQFIRRQREFESRLVGHIAQTRTMIDRLALAMSRVYPLDIEMAAELLNLDFEKVEQLFVDAKTYVFIKSLPDGRLTLHDEMRRMLDEHVWPLVDPQLDRRRRYSQLAAKWLDKKIKSLKRRIIQLGNEYKQVDNKHLSQQDLLERELWFLEDQMLFHTLSVDVNDGFELFIQSYDEAAKSYRPHVRRALLAHMSRYLKAVSPIRQFEVNKRQAQYLFDVTDYLEAKNILIEILKPNQLTETQQIDVLLLLANTEIRLANLSVGVEHFEEANKIASTLDDLAKQAQVRNALGWGYRRLGQFAKAVDCYNEALSIIGRVKDTLDTKRLRGTILNNMTYAYCRLEYLGLSESALDIGAKAEALWMEIGDRRGLGSLYIAYMTVFRRRRDFDKIIEYGEKAQEIFYAQKDIESLCRISYESGIAYWNKGNFEAAEKNFKDALQYKIRLYMPDQLYWLAETYISTKQIELAYSCSQEGYELARDPRNSRYHLYLLAQLAHIAELMNRTDLIDDLLAKYRFYQTYQKESKREEPAAEGLFFNFLGNLALECYYQDRKRSEYGEKAIEYYIESYPKIAKHVVYGDYPLPKLLPKLENKLSAAQDQEWVDFRRKLGLMLRKTWDSTQVGQLSLTVKYPYAIPYFDEWQQS